MGRRVREEINLLNSCYRISKSGNLLCDFVHPVVHDSHTNLKNVVLLLQGYSDGRH
jgi:hypothetical protein